MRIQVITFGMNSRNRAGTTGLSSAVRLALKFNVYLRIDVMHNSVITKNVR